MKLTAMHSGTMVNVADNYHGPRRGNCYAASESAFWLLGGKDAGWTPQVMEHEGASHWFLKHSSGLILNLTVSQFRRKPDYTKARGCGFLTVKPSKKAKRLMDAIVWQEG